MSTVRLNIPAHRGDGEHDYLWDWGFTRRGNQGIERFVERLGVAVGDDALVGDYVVIDLDRDLLPLEARQAARLGIVVDLSGRGTTR